jgi:hypothetical protein
MPTSGVQSPLRKYKSSVNEGTPKKGKKIPTDVVASPGNSTPKKSQKAQERTPPRSKTKEEFTSSSFLSAVSPSKSPFKSKIAIDAKVQKVYKLVTRRNQLGGNGHTGAIYGELTMGAMQKVINLMVDKCELTHKSRVIDVGAGLGKPNLHFAQDPACRLSLGVELEELRWKLSMFIFEGIVSEMSNDIKQKTVGPETKDTDDDGDSSMTVMSVPLHGGVNFVHGDIDDATTTDPFTHIYQFDLGFPPPLQQSIAKKFNESIHAQYLVSYRPPRRVIEEYGYAVEFIDQCLTSMFGSSENHTAYFYKRINRKGKNTLKNVCDSEIPANTVKITIPKRSGFAEDDVQVACAACYKDAVLSAVGKVEKLQRYTEKTVKQHLNAARPKRERRPNSRLV